MTPTKRINIVVYKNIIFIFLSVYVSSFKINNYNKIILKNISQEIVAQLSKAITAKLGNN